METTSTSSSSSSKERKRQHRWEQKNRWMAHYELKYGVVPTEFVLAGSDNGGSAVASATAATTPAASAALMIDGIPVVLKAKCRFCECFGRETAVASAGSSTSGAAPLIKSRSSAPEDDGEPDDAADFAAVGAGSGGELSVGGVSIGSVLDSGVGVGSGVGGDSDAPRASKRRKKRQTLKVFGPNFRTDNLESHLSREHPAKWREYERLRDSDKKDFFPDVPVFKEFLVAAAAAAAAAAAVQPHAGHHQHQLPSPTQQHVAGAAAAIALNSQLQSALAADAAASIGAPSTSGTGGGAAGASGLLGFSPSGFLGGKMLSFADKQQSSNGSGSNGSAGGPQSTKHLVPLSVMDMVDQLLSSRALSPGAAADTDPAAAAVQQQQQQHWWHQFVRMDDSLDAASLPAPADLKSIAAAGGDTFALAVRSESLVAFVADALSAGLSLDAALTMVHAAERWVLDPMVFGAAVTRADVLACVRSVVSVNLSAISMLTAFAWGYALLLRFETRYSIGYVDVRVQVAVHDEIQDLHVLAVPVDTHKHSPEAVVAAVVRALTAVDSRALEKLLGVTVDGDPYHMHKYKHVASLLRHEVAAATSNAAFYVLHSGAYHVNMVVEELLEICQEEFGIVATLADLEALTVAHASLMDEMGPEPPLPRRRSTASGTSGSDSLPHWVHVLHLCEWFAMQRETLTKWCHDHNELHRVPSNLSWVVVFLLRDILKDIHAAYVKCVEHASAFADVQRHLRELIVQLRLKFNVKAVGGNAGAPAPVAESGGSGTEAGGSGGGGTSAGDDVVDESGVVSADAMGAAAAAASPPPFLDLSEFSYQDFVHAVVPLDLFMYEAFQRKVIDGVGESERVHVHERFNALIFLLLSKFQGLASVSAESSAAPPGSGIDAATAAAAGVGVGATSPFPDFHQYSADIPPSTPYELITMNSVAFMALLNSQQFRIRAKWPSKVLSMITDERNRMLAEFSLRGDFYDAVSLAAKQQQHGTVVFRDVWRATSAQFAALSSFAVAFGCLLAVPRSEREGAPPLLSTLQLEAQLHARQFDRLTSLRKHFDTVV